MLAMFKLGLGEFPNISLYLVVFPEMLGQESLSFIVSIFTGFLIIAKIWFQTNPLGQLEYYYIYSPLTFNSGGKSIPVNLKLLVIVVGFFFIGLLAAWLFNRFVLKPIFGLLLVNSGVQNTIEIISQYFIVFIVLFISLGSVGLETVVWHLFLVLGFALLWSVKDPANDFIAYFIILIDRSVKIGDFIKINENISGVVRRITPRTIVLRQKNSISIIVPNSLLTKSSVKNWNYTQGFFAFEDFNIAVPYNSSPDEVKEVILKTIDDNINILKSPPPVVRLNEFGKDGMIFMIRGFLASVNVLNQWDIVSDLRFNIIKNLNTNGIPIATPVRLSLTPDDLKKMSVLNKKVKKENKDKSTN